MTAHDQEVIAGLAADLKRMTEARDAWKTEAIHHSEVSNRLRAQVAQLREFVFNAPTCDPTEENHYGWPKEGVRWRCFNCNEWCYPEAPCYGCDARKMQASLKEDR